MSCVPVPDIHRQILSLLRDGPRRLADLEKHTGQTLTGVVAELRGWGWLFGDLELSGVGWYHAGFLRPGFRG